VFFFLLPPSFLEPLRSWDLPPLDSIFVDFIPLIVCYMNLFILIRH
jgi:hypothetical protein